MTACYYCLRRWRFSHKETRLSSSEVRFYTKNDRFAFLSLFCGLGTTYDVHLSLIESAYSGLFISVNWAFLLDATVAATCEYRLKIGNFASTGSAWLKISGWRDRPHQPFFFSENYRLNDLSSCIKSWTDFFPFCHNPRVWQTDKQLSRSCPRWHFVQRGNNRWMHFRHLIHAKKLTRGAKFVVFVHHVWNRNRLAEICT